MNNSVLIILYSYSTLKGVGGRRWIKYSKELVKNGFNVFVLSEESETNNNEKSNNIKYFSYNSTYPLILDVYPENITNKIRYRIGLLYQSLKVKGTPYDKTASDKKNILVKAYQIIDEYKIKNIIVSGAPFSLMHIGAIIKLNRKNINLISDYRDGWTTGHGYGMNLIGLKRYNYEEFKERKVLQLSDIVFTASEDLKSQLVTKYKEYEDKINLLINGIEFEEMKTNELFETNKIFTIIHIGNVNSGTEIYWDIFFNAIKKNNINFKVIFIGLSNKTFMGHLESYSELNIEILKRVEEKKLFQSLKSADLFLAFKRKGFENSFPSKFFDYIKFRKPILMFSEKGIVTDEVENNNIGKSFNAKSNYDSVEEFLNSLINNTFRFNKYYDWRKFSTEHLVKNIISKLK